MSLAYLPGSSTDKRLHQIAKRLRGRVSTEFSGVIVGSKRVLYRYGTDYMQPRKGSKYGRWHWKTPFGREADRRKVDYVLLCGPKTNDAKETFFLCTVSQARRFAASWPTKLNFTACPLRGLRGNRAEFWALRLSLADLRQRLVRRVEHP